MPESLAPFAEDLTGKNFVFFGHFSRWPKVFGSNNAKNYVQRRGGIVGTSVNEGTDFLVVGRKAEKGRAAAIRTAEKLRGEGAAIQTVDEFGFLHLIRPDLKGKKFYFVGGFADPQSKVDGGLEGLLKGTGALVQGDIGGDLDLFIVGERRAKGKTGALRKLESLNAAGAGIQQLDEPQFLDLCSSLRHATSDGSGGEINYPNFVLQVRQNCDPRRLDRAITMLKKDSFKLYSDTGSLRLSGIVRSQSSNHHYACAIDAEGGYSCYGEDLDPCMGLQGKICKHLLVLLLGMTRHDDFDRAQALTWIRLAGARKPRQDDEESVAEVLLRFKGLEAGEVDWRPTETIPEDYYAL